MVLCIFSMASSILVFSPSLWCSFSFWFLFSVVLLFAGRRAGPSGVGHGLHPYSATGQFRQRSGVQRHLYTTVRTISFRLFPFWSWMYSLISILTNCISFQTTSLSHTHSRNDLSVHRNENRYELSNQTWAINAELDTTVYGFANLTGYHNKSQVSVCTKAFIYILHLYYRQVHMRTQHVNVHVIRDNAYTTRQCTRYTWHVPDCVHVCEDCACSAVILFRTNQCTGERMKQRIWGLSSSTRTHAIPCHSWSGVPHQSTHVVCLTWICSEDNRHGGTQMQQQYFMLFDISIICFVLLPLCRITLNDMT